MNIKELHEVFDAMVINDSEWYSAAEESMRFYTGGFGTGQWETEDLQTLQAEGRPPLQLNIILPKVNLVTGVERQGRSSWKARPVESDDENEAMLSTSLLYHSDTELFDPFTHLTCSFLFLFTKLAKPSLN